MMTPMMTSQCALSPGYLGVMTGQAVCVQNSHWSVCFSFSHTL